MLLVATLTFPIWVPYMVLAQTRRERCFRQRMRAMRRFIEWADLLPSLKRGDGTLIIEQAQKDGVRIWWTDQSLLASANVPQRPSEAELDYLRLREPHPFVTWCHERFTAGEKAVGLLTHPPYRYPPGFVEASFFRARFPRLAVIMTVKLV